MKRFDVEAVRAVFPGLRATVNGHPLAYLDNASTAQKPQAVLDRVRMVYETQCANIHRGVHRLSQDATAAYEAVRPKVAAWLGASDPDEVVFTRGTTEAINLVAQTWGRQHVQADDEIVVTELEHHSNLVPWQMLAAERGAHVRMVPIDDDGQVRVDALDDILSPRTKIVAVSEVSNSLGTVVPVAEIARRAHAVGAVVAVDGAQAVPHGRVDVGALGADFYAFSGHKVYGPTGAGVLWGRRALLERMAPWQGGGDMIESVSFSVTTYAEVPHKFEAGTPDIVGVIGLGAALDWLGTLDLEGMQAHEADLLAYGTERVGALEGIEMIGTAADKQAVLSFVVDGVHPHDVGTVLDLDGVAVRTGHHCTEPVMARFDVPATVRASFAAYNTRAEVDRLVAGLRRVEEMFR